MIESERIVRLREADSSTKGKYVLYWMQASQRVAMNHALQVATQEANRLDVPLIVCFGLMDDYPEANLRHYAFMLEGLRDVERQLKKLRVKFVVKRGSPAEVALHFAKHAAVLVCDRGYLRHQKLWRERVARDAKCAVVQVESDVVVPVQAVSDHAEFAARTIRPKIARLLRKYLVKFRATTPRCSSLAMNLRGDVDPRDIDAVLHRLKIDRSVSRSLLLKGGHGEAVRALRKFVREKLPRYSRDRNEPAARATSLMAPYLHFGQISPIEIALAVKDAMYREELIVRRELAMNFVHYSSRYDTYDCAVPAWARKTLREHARDPRPVVYSLERLETAQTGDRYWNAAQREMVEVGFMPNYMRMYWGKKIIEWTRSPKRAFEVALYLNNKYFLCGRDPVSYANVAWLFGFHDRPWGPARKIFGTVRYMNAAGLERKFDMEKYMEQVASLRGMGASPMRSAGRAHGRGAHAT